MKTQDKRGWNSSIKRRVYIVSERSKDDWKNNVFDYLPSNKNDHKGQTILLQKSLQLLFGEVVEFVRYSSFEPINHKLLVEVHGIEPWSEEYHCRF